MDRALVVLGLEGVKTLVLGFSLVGDLKRVKSRGGFDHVAYWRRALYAGTAAKILAEEFRVPLVEEAFLAALLMDIGMLSLDRALGPEYGAIASRAKSHDALWLSSTLSITVATCCSLTGARLWKPRIIGRKASAVISWPFARMVKVPVGPNSCPVGRFTLELWSS